MKQNQLENDARQWIASIISTRQDNFYVPDHFSDQRILQICVEEGVSSLLRYHLLQQKNLEQLTQALIQQLKSLDIQNIATQLARQSELATLLGLFGKQNLEPLLLKGEALAQTLYPSPHMRTRCDTDLFFADGNSAEKAWNILEKQGYQRIPTMQGRFSGFQYVSIKQLPSGITMELDIHNQINNYQWFAKRFPFEELFSESRLLAYPPDQEKQVKVRILSPVYQLLHACVHRVCNKARLIENRLIWLYDILLLCRSLSDDDRNKLTHVAHQKQLSGILLEGINATAMTFATPVGKGLLEQLAENSANEAGAFNPRGRRIFFYLQDWKETEGITNKLQHLREKLFPPANYVIQKYQFKNRFMLPFYYLKRFFDLIFRQ